MVVMGIAMTQQALGTDTCCNQSSKSGLIKYFNQANGQSWYRKSLLRSRKWT